MAKDKSPFEKALLSPEEREANRAELDALLALQGLAMTDASPDPKDPRKQGPPLTPDQQKRLHELHYLV